MTKGPASIIGQRQLLTTCSAATRAVTSIAQSMVSLTPCENGKRSSDSERAGANFAGPPKETMT